MTVHGFELIEERHIPEINSQAKIYRHAKTGARLLSLENDDENKVFGVAFATPPEDSTGLPHILEHSVLCGSQTYPVKEPFKELRKGSLNTFLNAFTWPDKTVYPVASQNQADFYNLIQRLPGRGLQALHHAGDLADPGLALRDRRPRRAARPTRAWSSTR